MMAEFYPEGILIDTLDNKKALRSYSGLEKAMQEEKILEARAVMCDKGFNLIFDLGEVRGFMPKSEVACVPQGEKVRDIAAITRVGKPCAFLVESIETDEEGVRFARLSRRKAQEKCLEKYLDLLEDGDILEARVTHFEPFGAFCDIGCGIASLLSIDCISVSRISHPSDRFSVGDKILCAVRGRDEIRLGNRGRIALTHKELLGTWLQNAEKFSIGQTVVGIVRSIETYGIFVELTPNLAGLCEWRSDVSVGQACAVYIKNIIPQKMKIKLVLIDTFPAEKSEVKNEYFLREGNIRSFRYAPEEHE